MSIRRAALALAGAAGAAYTYAATTDLYAGPIGRYIQSLDPEDAHNLALKLAKRNLAAPPTIPFFNPDRTPPALGIDVFGMKFKHPIGLAAGFDKNGEAVRGLFNIGFAFIEVGSVTPRPQPGNPKPRVFRLPEDGAIINRYGFNSDGADAVFHRLYTFDYGGMFQHNYGVLGVNLGKNKNTPQERATDDYVEGLRRFGNVAEYIVINVSSPNTPGLRSLQARQALTDLLTPVMEQRDKTVFRPPIIVKIAPDLTDHELEDICAVVQELGINGLIVSNTTIDKSKLINQQYRDEMGGVSGRPLREKSTRMIGKVYQLTHGKVPIIGVGGVESGQDAYDKIRAGASLIQLYTALAYHGPWVVRRIKSELAELLKRDGFASVVDAVGIDHRINMNKAINNPAVVVTSSPPRSS